METICKDCRNDAICKFKEEASRVCEKADEIEITMFSPIKVEVECRSFEKKTQKQDGIYFRT